MCPLQLKLLEKLSSRVKIIKQWQCYLYFSELSDRKASDQNVYQLLSSPFGVGGKKKKVSSYPEVQFKQKVLSFCYQLAACNFILRVFVFQGFCYEDDMYLLKDQIFQNTKKEFIASLKININLWLKRISYWYLSSDA